MQRLAAQHPQGIRLAVACCTRTAIRPSHGSATVHTSIRNVRLRHWATWFLPRQDCQRAIVDISEGCVIPVIACAGADNPHAPLAHGTCSAQRRQRAAGNPDGAQPVVPNGGALHKVGETTMETCLTRVARFRSVSGHRPGIARHCRVGSGILSVCHGCDAAQASDPRFRRRVLEEGGTKP